MEKIAFVKLKYEDIAQGKFFAQCIRWRYHCPIAQ